MGNDWHHISESERPGYLNGRAKEIVREYGGDSENSYELNPVKEALCIVWGWDPKKYIKGFENDGNDENDVIQAIQAREGYKSTA